MDLKLIRAQLAPYVVLIRVVAVLALVGYAYLKGREHALDSSEADAAREAATAQRMVNAFNAAWEETEGKRAAERAETAQAAAINSEEIAREISDHLRVNPFDVRCRWPAGLQRSYAAAVRQANAAADGLSGPPAEVPEAAKPAR